jgi:hypothetical protein
MSEFALFRQPQGVASYTSLAAASTPVEIGKFKNLMIAASGAAVWVKFATSSTNATAGTASEFLVPINSVVCINTGDYSFYSLIQAAATAVASVTTV